MGQVSTEQTVQIIDAVSNAMNHPEFIGRSEPNMAFGLMALIALLPMIVGGVVAWFKRHVIIGWVKNRTKIGQKNEW